MSTENGLIAQHQAPVVHLSPNGNAFATSTDVAAFFDKRHSHVLRAIERLLADVAEHEDSNRQPATRSDLESLEEHQPNIGLMFEAGLFEATEISVRLGNGAIRLDRAYNISRDGFALLAMGFTGKHALAFKLAYIAAFNAMETKLRELYVAPLPSDKEFTRGIRIKDMLVLHEQARKASRALSDARNEDEQRQAYWQLYQINTALGIPMPSMQALGVVSLSVSSGIG